MLTANLLLGALSGLFGAVVMTLCIYVLNKSGVHFDILYLIGTRFVDPRQKSKAYTVGTIVHLLIGALWGVLYIILIMGMSEIPRWTLGLLFGFAHGFFSGIILSTVADANPNVGNGKAISDPGMFGNRWGKSVPFYIFVVHMVFGLVTVISYNWMYISEMIPRVKMHV